MKNTLKRLMAFHARYFVLSTLLINAFAGLFQRIAPSIPAPAEHAIHVNVSLVTYEINI